MKDRVHELAKEFGIPSKEIIAELSALGEFVKSASSTLETPVARRLRERLNQRHLGSTGHRTGRVSPPEPTDYERPMYRNDGTARLRPQLTRPIGNHPFTNPGVRPRPLRPGTRPGTPTAYEPLPQPKPKKPRRKWYDGPDLNDIVLTILRRGLVTKEGYHGKQPPPGRYFEDEVRAAKAIHDDWAEAAFELMLVSDEGAEAEIVVDWLGVEGTKFDPEEALTFHRAGIRPTELERVEEGASMTFRARFRYGELTVADVVAKVRRMRLMECARS